MNVSTLSIFQVHSIRNQIVFLWFMLLQKRLLIYIAIHVCFAGIAFYIFLQKSNPAGTITGNGINVFFFLKI